MQAGTHISLADLSFSDETCTLWYNLLPCKQIPGKKNKEQNEESMFLLSKQSSDSLDLVSDVLAITVITRKKARDSTCHSTMILCILIVLPQDLVMQFCSY